MQHYCPLCGDPDCHSPIGCRYFKKDERPMPPDSERTEMRWSPGKYRHGDERCEAAKVTHENIHDVAKWCGGTVHGVQRLGWYIQIPAEEHDFSADVGDYVMIREGWYEFGVCQPKGFELDWELDEPSLSALKAEVERLRRVEGAAKAASTWLNKSDNSAIVEDGYANHGWMIDVIKFMATTDEQSDLHFWIDGDDLKVDVNCSDLFCWGSADSESIESSDLPSLKAAHADVEAVVATFPRGVKGDDRWLDQMHWTQLWCARKREMRPQGAFLLKCVRSDEVRQLFADAGPQRQGGVLGDPWHIELPPSPTPGAEA